MAPQKSPRSTSATLRPALRRVERGGGAEHPAADDGEIERAARERVEVAMHGGHRGLRPQAGALAVAASFLVRTFTSLP